MSAENNPLVILHQNIVFLFQNSLSETSEKETNRGIDFYSSSQLAKVFTNAFNRFFTIHGYPPKLSSPQTFSEKLFAMKFLYPYANTEISSKLGVKDYIKNNGLACAVPPTIWQGEEIYDLANAHIKSGEFVLKSNRGSGTSQRIRAPFNDLDETIINKANAWKNQAHGYQWGEWWYATHKPTLFVEEWLGEQLDYKIWNFHGIPQFIQVDIDRFTNHKRNFYDTRWNLIELSLTYPNSPKQVAKPNTLKEMLEISKKISLTYDFVRVDFYEYQDRVYIGEVTFCPGNAEEIFNPIEADKVIGGLLKNSPQK